MKSLLIVIPTYNEASVIQESLLRLNEFVQKSIPDHEVKIVVADNASVDASRDIIRSVANTGINITLHEVAQKGKGVAIRSAWETFGASYDALMFMDADLAVDLNALPSMLRLMDTHDAVIANRYHENSHTKRSLLRRLASRIFRMLMRSLLKSKISDFPCGCKMIKTNIALSALPTIQNDQWFFDSELMYRLEKNGIRIAQLPVTWTDRESASESKVSVIKVGSEYLKEIKRLLMEK